MIKGQFRILMVLTVVAGFLGGAVSNLAFRSVPAMAQATEAQVQEAVSVAGVTDGDTFSTQDGRLVRLLGLDAPEVYREGLGTEYYSAEATQALRSLVEGHSVLLWRDTEDCDQYGRLLRYIFLEDGAFVNWYLVRYGFAQALDLPPNSRFHEVLLDAQIQAKREGLGMWAGPIGQYTLAAPAVVAPAQPSEVPSAPAPSTAKQGTAYAAAEAWQHIGEYASVEYVAANPYRSSTGDTFLNEERDYRSGFTTVIFANVRSRWSQEPIAIYGGKRLRVTGMIKMYEGHPEIIADDPSLIEILE